MIPRPQRQTGTAITGPRWELAPGSSRRHPRSRPTGPPAAWSCSSASPLTRIAALTTSEIISHGDDEDVSIRLGQHEIPVPAPLGHLLLTLAPRQTLRRHRLRPGDRMAVPGLLPSRPITPGPPAERLRAHGVPVMAGRRTALIDLAAQMPAAVLADSIGFRPATAVRWRHQAGADWNRYAAELARKRNHEPGE